MDFSKFLKGFGMSEEELEQRMQEAQENPMVQQMLHDPGLQSLMGQFEGISAQGGIMPDDVDNLLEKAGAAAPGGLNGLLSGVSNMLGSFLGAGFDEIDLDEEIEDYEPETEDASDRAFVIELKAWLKEILTEIPDKDVCAFAIGYHSGFADEELTMPVHDLWLAYDTDTVRAQNIEKYGNAWNFVNWANDSFRSFDEEPFREWREEQGYDEDPDDADDMTEHIYDLAAVAVMELHAEQFTEKLFGKKLPFLIEDFEFNQKTAIRAAKVNGKEMFDPAFYQACGFSTDGDET